MSDSTWTNVYVDMKRHQKPFRKWEVDSMRKSKPLDVMITTMSMLPEHIVDKINKDVHAIQYMKVMLEVVNIKLALNFDPFFAQDCFDKVDPGNTIFGTIIKERIRLNRLISAVSNSRYVFDVATYKNMIDEIHSYELFDYDIDTTTATREELAARK
jgi:hypothetical protein